MDPLPITCTHWSADDDPAYGRCTAGHFDGRPHKTQCLRQCTDHPRYGRMMATCAKRQENGLPVHPEIATRLTQLSDQDRNSVAFATCDGESIVYVSTVYAQHQHIRIGSVCYSNMGYESCTPNAIPEAVDDCDC